MILKPQYWLVPVLLLISCTDSPESLRRKISGKWKEAITNRQIELKWAGTFSESSSNGYPKEGKWKLFDAKNEKDEDAHFLKTDYTFGHHDKLIEILSISDTSMDVEIESWSYHWTKLPQ